MRTNIARGATVAAFAIGMGVQPASAQNVFEMLFGGPRYEGRSAYQQDYDRQNAVPEYGRQSPLPTYGRRGSASYGTLDPSDPRLHRAIIRHRAAAKPVSRRKTTLSEASGSSTRETSSSVAKETSGSPIKNSAVVATADAPRGSIPYFLKDKTLRAGDVVVTDKGFLIYQGGEHSARAFVAINSSGSRKSDRSSLLALEQASKMRTPNLTVELTPSIRDFVGPRLPEQMDERFNAALTTKTASR